MKTPLPALAAFVMLAACATDGGPYPSLAPRAIEKGSFDEPARPMAVATPDAALDATIVRQSGEVDRIAKGFDSARLAAERSLARPGTQVVGSDAWLDAQAALARLDDWRSQLVGLVTVIEQTASARAARLDPAYHALDTLVARAGTESEREAQAVADLQRRLPGV